MVDLQRAISPRISRRVHAPPRVDVHPPEVLIDALAALLGGGWQNGFDVHIDIVPKPPKTRPVWVIGPVTDVTTPPVSPPAPPSTSPTLVQGDVQMQLLDSQQVALSIAAKDKAGNVVPVPGTLAWSVSDEAIATLVDNGDGTQTLVTTGTLGSVAVTVTDDVDGDGTAEFVGSLAVDVVAGAANEIVVSAAEPTDRA